LDVAWLSDCMTCPHCNRPGRFIGLWLCRKRVIGKRYACDNPACRFKYESWHDGEKEARPTWGVTKGDNGDVPKNPQILDRE